MTTVNIRDLQGEEAKVVQKELQKHGYYSGEIDGIIGINSINGFVQFKQDHWLEHPEILGETTWSKLKAEPKKRKFVIPCSGIYNSPYGMRTHPITGKKRLHAGIDIASPLNTKVFASASGEVTYCSVSGSLSSGYGRLIIINHLNGLQSYYAHLNQFKVSLGQKVAQGELIAYMGSSGSSTGSHLHFEIRENGKTIDPCNYLSKINLKQKVNFNC